MPIRPENRKRYPKNWRKISERIRHERAKGRCECVGECGLDHANGGLESTRCPEWNGMEHTDTGSIVVLTVAHLDHQPENCADDNLKAMCQRCHNRYDAPMRRRGMRERGLTGVYHHASPKHLGRYVNEFAFRLNEGDVKRHTLARLDSFIANSAGRRLTYRELTA